MPLEKKDPDEIVTRHTHTCTVQCNMQFDNRSGQLESAISQANRYTASPYFPGPRLG